MSEINSNDYSPIPMDNSQIRLDSNLMQVTELLARNIHELWAFQRMAEGWISGPAYDNFKKTNPNLIPYEQLKDSEKEYDRKIVIETLKLLIREGFSISKK